MAGRIFSHAQLGNFEHKTRDYNNIKTDELPIRFQTLSPHVKAPYKEYPTEVGWKIQLNERTDGRLDDAFGEISMFDTKLILQAPPNYYLEVRGEDELYRLGYYIPGGSLIIQPLDHNEIVIPLIKFMETPDLELPMDVLRVIPHKHQNFTLTKVRDMNDSSLKGDIQEQTTTTTNNRNIVKPLQRKPLPTNHMW